MTTVSIPRVLRALCFAGLLGQVARPPVAASPQPPVTGANLTKAWWGPNGTQAFALVGPRVWVELGADGKPTFGFREHSRDEWSVFLVDEARAMRVQVDLFKKQIYFHQGSGNALRSGLLGHVTRAEATPVALSSMQRAFPPAGVAPNGVPLTDLALGGAGIWTTGFMTAGIPLAGDALAGSPVVPISHGGHRWTGLAQLGGSVVVASGVPSGARDAQGNASWGVPHILGGGLSRVAVDPEGRPWAVDLGGAVLHLESGGRSWVAYPGVAGVDVGVSASGNIWVAERGGGIALLNLGGAAARVNGAQALRIAGHPSGDAWIVDSRGVVQIVNGATGTLVPVPGAPPALDVGIGRDGSVYLVGRDLALYRRDGQAWPVLDATRKYVAVSADCAGDPWALTATGEIFRRVGFAFPPPVAAARAPRPTRTVDGYSVARVGLAVRGADRGHFIQTGGGRWSFVDPHGKALRSFVEVARAKGAVDLDEIGAGGAPAAQVSSDKTLVGQVTGMDGSSVRLDLEQKKVYSRPGLALEWGVDGDAVDPAANVGWLIVGVEYGRAGTVLGTFTRENATTWSQAGSPCEPLLGAFTEHSRDEWSVYLRDTRRQATVQLDLYSRKVTYKDPKTTETWDLQSARSVTPASCGLVVSAQTVLERQQNSRYAYYQVDGQTWREARTAPPPCFPPGGAVAPGGAPRPAPAADLTATELVLLKRDAHSIYLVDKFKNLQGVTRTIRLDLERGTVHWAVGPTAPVLVTRIDYAQVLTPEQTRAPPPVGRSRGPGFQVINRTQWPVQISLDQTGCLYYGVIQPGEVFQRVTGAVWFTIKADIVPDGKCHITDWSCAKPVVSMVAQILLTAATAGYGAFGLASLSGVTGWGLAGVTAKAALIEGARAAATKGIIAGVNIAQEAGMEGLPPELTSVVQGATSFALGQASDKGAALLGSKLVLPLTAGQQAVQDDLAVLKTIKKVLMVGPTLAAKIGEVGASNSQAMHELEALFEDSSDAYYGQYAGPPWPFRRPMPQYVVTGGPRRVHRTIQDDAAHPVLEETLLPGDPLKVTLLLR